ncbi:MAG: hypothetical protein C3F07_01715 [Anaerolineales bacterium]|nr:hypothetical protein [Anaerolineae bacterium]PWB77675.1 MAG: hypothetical protein C3F07_01715 [Anaerolineales bacterium]
MKRIHPAIVLLLVAILAYGLLAPQLGFYWDDQPMSWIRYQLGPEAMAQYFSTNRPVWGMLYQVTTRLLPQVPVYWQVFALLWRWLGAVVVWLIVRELWRDRPRFALGAALFFLLYPGFNQQWGAYLYSHFFIVLFFFLLSLHLMLRGRTIPALIFSALNLWMMEYFFVLELARVGLIWTALRDSHPDPKERLKPTFRLWLPYLALFALAVLSRLFIFNNQVYGFSLMSQLRADPVATILGLIQNFFVSLWVVSGAAWAQIFTGIDPSVHGTRTIALYVAVMLVVLAGVGLYLFRQNEQTAQRRSAWYAVGLGLFMLPFAGVPFWTTGLVISLAHPASRFTLPFMLGVSLILAGLLEFIPQSKIRNALFALLIGLAAGRQFLWSVDYLRDWQSQKNLFWQLTWRAPGIQPDTLVLMNEELSFYADNSISAPLNWIYAPDNKSGRIDYVLFYPTNRLNSSLPGLQPGLPIHYDYLAGTFEGNTSQALAFYYSPPACLRLLEPDLDSNNRFILDDSLMRVASALSNADRIVAEQKAVMPAIYGPEPEHGWCYYFQKADLARQMGDWETVVKLGNQAFKLDDFPNNPVERFVFIEGYAHVGDWDRAIELSKMSYRVSKDYVGPLLCQLWKRMETETDQSPERSEASAEVQSLFACGS